ncbi:MAG: response regulator transcription factor [Clostridia bacterium]|nr:response regulator transcription factor [Clostridia bacterium]MBR7032088.1 response regulator transcription factor [Clostridia bacterium]
MKLLVIDDDVNICELISLYFEKEGFEVKAAHDGADGMIAFRTFDPDIVLLDIMLPGKDGGQVCREIRKISSRPVVMITARGDVFDRVLGLELGADDYITKPFDMREVHARVKAVLRRYRNPPDAEGGIVRYDNLEINRPAYEVKVGGRRIAIPSKEFELLDFLASNPDRTFTRDQLLDKIWGFDYLGDSRTVDVHVKRLRSRLQGASDKWSIKTVWGVGYKFEVLE